MLLLLLLLCNYVTIILCLTNTRTRTQALCYFSSYKVTNLATYNKQTIKPVTIHVTKKCDSYKNSYNKMHVSITIKRLL